jgi:autotransporter-associated beta strand protein
MRFASLRFAALGAIVSLLLSFAATANAGTICYWYSSGSSGGQGGPGTWDTTSADWYSAGSYHSWPNTTDYDANFGGGSAAVSLGGGTITVGGLIVDTTGYSLTTGTLNLGGDGITTHYGSGTSTISAAVSLLSDQTWAVGSGGSLTVNGWVSINGQALTVNSNGTMLVTRAVSGSGTITKTGTGLLYLAVASSSYSGGFTLSAGTLGYGNASAFGTGTLTLSGGTFSNNVLNQLANAIYVTPGANTYLVPGGTTGTIDMQLSGGLTGSGTLTYSSTGSQIALYGNNGGFSGTLYDISSGTSGIIIYNPVSGSSQATFVLNGSGSKIQGNLSTTGTVSLGALSGTASGSTNYINNFNSANTTTVTYAIGGANLSTTYAGHIYDQVSGTTANYKTALMKVGTGTLTLTNANAYSGGTILNGGTLLLGNSAALGNNNATNGGTISFTGGALAYSSSNTTDYSFRFVTTAGQAYKINTNGQNVSFATGLNSSGATLDKYGAGTLTLTKNNTYNGITNIYGGTLQLNATLLINMSSGTINIDTNSAFVISPTSAPTLNSVFTGSGSITKIGTSMAYIKCGASTFTGTITSYGNQLLCGALLGAAGHTISASVINTGNATNGIGGWAFDSASAWTFPGTIIGSGSVTFYCGTVTLAQASSYTGLTTVGYNSGATPPGSVAIFGHDNATGNGDLTVTGNGGTQSGTLDLAGYSGTSAVVTLQGNGSIIGTGGGTLTSTGGFNVAQGYVSAVLAGGVGLTKSGTATVTLAGVNTYTGATTVSAGVLVVNGSVASPVNVVAGVLGGNGTLYGNVTVGTATVAPGSSPATLTISNAALALSSSSTLSYELCGTDTTVGGGINDLIQSVTDLTLDGTLNVTETVAGSFLSAQYGDKWTLITYTGSLTDNGLELGAMPTLSPSLHYSVNMWIPGQVNLIIVPEPGTLTLLAAGLIALVAYAWRKRK